LNGDTSRPLRKSRQKRRISRLHAEPQYSGGKKPVSARGVNAEKDSGFLFQFPDLVVDVLPHVAMEGKGQFTKRTGQYSSLK